MAKDNKKEIKKEDVIKHSDIYKEHFSEKQLIDRTESFIYNYLIDNNIYSKEEKWEGLREVYGKLPFGDPAVYLVKTKDGKNIKVDVSIDINEDEEIITVYVSTSGCKREEFLIPHLAIRHGYVNWNALGPVDIQITISEARDDKEALKVNFDPVSPRKLYNQQPQIPLWMLPY